MQLGAMSENVLYPIKIFMGEGSRAEFLRIRYQRDNGGFISSWEGMLQNLETGNLAVTLLRCLCC